MSITYGPDKIDNPGHAFEQRFAENVRKMSEQDLTDIASRLSTVISNLIVYVQDPFLKWLLLQAPIKITHPDPSISGIPTMGSATDGYVYINPAFWNTVFSLLQESTSDRQKQVEELLALILHEMFHFVLHHTWSMDFVRTEGVKRDLPFEYCMMVANVCEDVIVNTILKENLINTTNVVPMITENTFFSQLNNIAIDVDKMQKTLGIQGHWSWSCMNYLWNELYIAALDSVDKNQFKRITIQANVISGGTHTTHGTEVKGEGKVSRGEKIEDDSKGIGESSAQQEYWEKIFEQAMLQARQAGNVPVGLARYFDKILETRIPWNRVIKTHIHNTIMGNNVTSAWHITSRRNNDYPGRRFNDVGKFYILMDTSGSIGKEEIEAMAGVAMDALKYANRSSDITIIPWDTKAYDPIIISNRQQLLSINSLQGGGGTAIVPALDKVLNSKTKVGFGDIVVVCTDTCIGDLHTQEFSNGIAKIVKNSGNKILWVSFYDKNSAEKSLTHVSQYMHIIHRSDYAS